MSCRFVLEAFLSAPTFQPPRPCLPLDRPNRINLGQKRRASLIKSELGFEANSAGRALSLAISKRKSSRIPSLFNAVLLSDERVTSDTFLSALNVCKSNGDIDGATRILRRGIEDDDITQHLKLRQLVSSICFICERGGNPNNVLNILETMYQKGIKTDTRLIVRLAKNAIKRRAYDHAIKYVEWIDTKSMMNEYSYAVLLKSYGCSKNVVQVRKYVKKIMALGGEKAVFQLDSVLFNSVLDALVQCNDFRYARQFLFNQSYVHLVDSMSYNIVIKGLIINQQQSNPISTVREAFRLVSRMQATGIQLDAVTVNTLISACVAAKEFETAKQLLNYYVQDTSSNVLRLSAPSMERPASPPEQVRKRLLNYNREDWYKSEEDEMIVSQNEENADNDGEVLPIISLDMPKQQSQQQPQSLTEKNYYYSQFRIAMTTLLCGLAEAGKINQSMQMLEDMHQRQITPNGITYASLVSACIIYGASEKAIEIYEGVRRFVAGKHIDKGLVLKALIQGLSQRDETIDRADEIIRDKSRGHPSVTIDMINMMIDGYVRSGRLDKAEQYLYGCCKELNLQPTTSSFTTLMKGYSQAGRYTSAKRTFSQMTKNKGLRQPDIISLNTLIAACVRSNDLETALRTLSYMERNGGCGSGAMTVSAHSYSPILLRYAKQNAHKHIMLLYERIQRHQVPLNDYLIGVLGEYIIKRMRCVNLLKDKEDVEELAQLTQKILEDGMRDTVSLKMLRATKRKLCGLFPQSIRKRYFTEIMKAKECQSVSETIFERHGWNNIESGWRFL